jgi:hypothetical protein
MTTDPPVPPEAVTTALEAALGYVAGISEVDVRLMLEAAMPAIREDERDRIRRLADQVEARYPVTREDGHGAEYDAGEPFSGLLADDDGMPSAVLVHYRWPPACGTMLPGAIWSGDSIRVTCGGCQGTAAWRCPCTRPGQSECEHAGQPSCCCGQIGRGR